MGIILIKKLRYPIFFLILFLLPLNLGKHFELAPSYINGILVDYLVPTVYLQDILVAFFVLLSLGDIFNTLLRRRYVFLYWFLFTIFLSAFNVYLAGSELFGIAVFLFARVLLYSLFSISLGSFIRFEFKFEGFTRVLAISVGLLSLLAFAQWVRQASIFNNYLFFGEQPYSYSTFDINKENFFGVLKIPPYATFRHPNVFGGFLSIVLLWILQLAKKSRAWFLWVVFIFGCIALFLTLSSVAWLSFGLGVLLLHFLRKGRGNIISLIFVLCMVASFFIPYAKVSELPSFYRRASLAEASYSVFGSRWLFGLGYGLFTAFVSTPDFFVPQPVHNIFILLLVESGVLALLLFFAYLLQVLLRAKNTSPLLYVSILQFGLLGCFDHYIFTSHQLLLLFWLIIGLV
ncbi:hypothetical protein KAZ57_01675 [Patescibacteria group bacterium]|nr:hypothetical protein [Patescibacteria group bacterium]